MGYSCSAKASEVEKAMIEILQEGSDINQSNVWDRKSHRYFIEIGKEQRDGAITATVMKMNGIPQGDGVFPCKRSGGIRIEPDGFITRWPTTTKAERRLAQAKGVHRFEKKHSDLKSLGSDGRPMFEIID